MLTLAVSAAPERDARVRRADLCHAVAHAPRTAPRGRLILTCLTPRIGDTVVGVMGVGVIAELTLKSGVPRTSK